MPLLGTNEYVLQIMIRIDPDSGLCKADAFYDEFGGKVWHDLRKPENWNAFANVILPCIDNIFKEDNNDTD